MLLLLAAGSLSLVLAAGLATRAYRYLNVFQEVWGLTRSNYVEPVDEAVLLDGALHGMVASLDGASAYLAPGEEKILAAPPGPGRPGMETLPSGGGAVIVRVDPEGPAAKAGLDVGDQIWKIAGRPVRQQPWPETKRRLAGAVGGKLDLVVLDGRTFKLRELQLPLEAPRGGGYIVTRRDGPIIHLRMLDPEFMDDATLARDLARQLTDNPGAPLLVDLRGVVGLDPAAVARIGSVFFPGGPVLKVVDRAGTEDVINAPAGRTVALPRRVYVLVDTSTAGAGEALAALLREKAGALLCGRSTFALAGLPEVIPLSRGGSVLMATREMRTPAGTRWSEKGLSPDKILTPAARAAAGEEPRDQLLDDALHWIGEGAPLDKPSARARPAA